MPCSSWTLLGVTLLLLLPAHLDSAELPQLKVPPLHGGRSEAREEEERLIGWQGNTWKPPVSSRGFIETLSWSPRAMLWHQFLSDDEARHIIQLGQVHMRPSTVVAENGSSVLDPYRTSYGTFLSRKQDAVVAAIEERIAAWTHVPSHHGEDLQVLRYGHGQKYDAHTDSLDNDSPRLATVLIYLSTPAEGGETVFCSPLSAWAHPGAAAAHGDVSECARQGGGVAAKARRGDALLFFSIRPDGSTPDPASEHAGCPILRGVKWSATKWIHTLPYAAEETPGQTTPDPGACTDSSRQCPRWAAAGECTSNAGYMVGSEKDGSLGNCRRACKACEACGQADQDCYERNRVAAGVLVFDPDELL